MNSAEQELLDRLRSKYQNMGQDLCSYLDGLLTSNSTTYWDYINLDTLLTLQQPKTDFPDESIFIMYHQITELYFKLSRHELDQISVNGIHIEPNGHATGFKKAITPSYLTERIRRINEYFRALTTSFDIMIDGMEKEQFVRFRMALLPASGFQSAQYRMIEISCTDLINLVNQDQRHSTDPSDLQACFDNIYWKRGATELETGKKTLTLKQFEAKYSDQLFELAIQKQNSNVWKKYKSLSDEDQRDPSLIKEMRQLDVNVNINWPLCHYKSAVRYLSTKEGDVPATGGTNWQKYLPPRFQKRIFFPELWSREEMDNWGKGWVEEVLATSLKIKHESK